MKYASQVVQTLPIGSGETEASCKMFLSNALLPFGNKIEAERSVDYPEIENVNARVGGSSFWVKASQYGTIYC